MIGETLQPTGPGTTANPNPRQVLPWGVPKQLWKIYGNSQVVWSGTAHERLINALSDAQQDRPNISELSSVHC